MQAAVGTNFDWWVLVCNEFDPKIRKKNRKIESET
jgi:hypothetical protein